MVRVSRLFFIFFIINLLLCAFIMDVNEIIQSLGENPEKLSFEKVKQKISNVRITRATHKRKVTIYINKLAELHSNKTLSNTLCKKQIKVVEEELSKVREYDEIINLIMQKTLLGDRESSFFNEELDGQAAYSINTAISLDEYEVYLVDKPVDPVPDKKSLPEFMFDGKPPPLQCSFFNGRERDKFAYPNFKQQFDNVIGSKKHFSNSAKLSYLISYLKGYALKQVSHLSISDDNYVIAWKLLDDEFLDKPFIIDETLKNILNAAPSNDYDSEYSNVKLYISEVRSYLYELQKYNVDFLADDTPGNLFVSHIISNKLPKFILKELISRTEDNYPSLNLIFDSYKEVLKTLSRTNNANKKVKEFKKSSFKESAATQSTALQLKDEKIPTVQNFEAVVGKPSKFSCKLCLTDGHSIGSCDSFKTYEAKIARISELSLCPRCAGSGHSEGECYGNKGKMRFPCMVCKKREHITPLCPNRKAPTGSTKVNLCYATRSLDISNILPTMTLELKNGKRMRRVRGLVDCGSQRSYLMKNASLALCSNYDQLYNIEHDVGCYIGEETVKFKQMSTGLKIGSKMLFIPLLVDDQMSIKFEIPGMNAVIKNLKAANIKLADDYFYTNGDYEQFEIEMLIGIDIIQHFSLNINHFAGGKCFVVNDKVAPVGNILNFLDSEQSKELINSHVRKPVVNECVSARTKTMINLVMDPIKSYFNPLDHILTDSEIENGLENLFSFESLGINNSDSELVSYDKEQIHKFKEGIFMKDGHYHVNLPWYPEKVEKVPSNHFIALKVLDRTLEKLNKNGLVKKYEEVFDKQLEDGIIEEIKVNPSDYNEFTWIPHRPVIRTEAQVTTKIRPVFNCSLKTSKDLPSLNEAAYTGIDLMGSILKLLFYFRTNQFTMLSDIKSAFLMIKLAKEYDQNRFCFFWKRGSRLVCYRYKTIVFGYTSSPFILNYVMKHHNESYPNDKCRQILDNKFYVDNLIVTSNDPGELHELYNLCFDRMREGGFILRSWNSNSIELRNTMKSDNRLVEHGCTEEKVLGYKYNVYNDTLSIAKCVIESEADTKRQILSQVSKVFDPLNFALPVTIKGRILMRKVWKLGTNWDQKVPKEISSEMKAISRDFEMLSQISFSRQAINEQTAYGLHIFCDSSTEAYGFVMYACNEENKGSFLFAKSKLAPLRKGNEHSVPTLELMGVVLALKCLPTLLESYNNIQFQFINICVDAQVVLNWIITKEPKVKSKFLRNRILETNSLESEISNKFNIPISYHYVHTEQNPADLLTRGITYGKFLSVRDFWLKGPEWLTNNFDNWPKFPLLSISPDHKFKINVNFVNTIKVNTGILNINKFSSYEKLLWKTSFLFRYLCTVKGGDPMIKALEYWIKTSQREHFSREIEFLQSNVQTDKDVPLLVSNLNLFLDPKGILRSRGRIAKCLYFDYNVYNPVLLPKGHPFTSLYISYCHAKVQHMGTGTTLNYIREQGYWIPKGLVTVKSVINSCKVCQKYNALAYKYPKMVDMPKHHMNLVKPFMHVGVDYTGHFWVKDESTGSSIKMFILIFTCLNIRAVHFELLPDMTTRNFLLAFQRFCNMYAVPQYLYSDNARTFIKGGCILESSLTSTEFQAELNKCNIKHVRIPLYSAWVGAAWERLIRVLKNCLYKVVGRSRLSYFDLLTTLSNIKLAINSRPLTYRASTANLEFITPNSFLRLHGNSSLVLRKEEEEVWKDIDPESLENTLDLQEEILNNFKNLWYEQYLLSLRERSKHLYQGKWEDRIKVGDIVLIKAPNRPRPFWMLGRVLEIIMGFDSKVRSVKVKQGNGAIEYHSVCNLFPMEISTAQKGTPTQVDAMESSDQDGSLQVNNEKSANPDTLRSVRPKRKATERFQQMMRDNISYL